MFAEILTSTSLSLPTCMAVCSGVSPASSFMVTSTPHSRSLSTILYCFERMAVWRGVLPESSCLFMSWWCMKKKISKGNDYLLWHALGKKETCLSWDTVLLFADNFPVDPFHLPFTLLISFMASSSSPARMNLWSLSAVSFFCTTE